MSTLKRLRKHLLCHLQATLKLVFNKKMSQYVNTQNSSRKPCGPRFTEQVEPVLAPRQRLSRQPIPQGEHRDGSASPAPLPRTNSHADPQRAFCPRKSLALMLPSAELEAAPDPRGDGPRRNGTMDPKEESAHLTVS